MPRIYKLQNYEKCYPSRLKKYFQSDIQYRSYDKFVLQTKHPVLGNIPPEIINVFEPNLRGQNIKIFQRILGDISNDIRQKYNDLEFTRYNTVNLSIHKRGTKIAKFAEKRLNKSLALFFNDKFKATLEYVDYGAYKEVFKLIFLDKNNNKITHDKAFHCYRSILSFMYPQKHGNFAEGNFWTFLKYRAGHPLDKTQFTKHYISDFKNGYALTEFADENITKTTTPINICKNFGLSNSDTRSNPYIEGKQYDVGGFSKNEYFINDKVVYKFYKKIINRNTKSERITVAQNLEKIIKNPKTPHRDKIQQAVEFYKKQFPYEYKSTRY